jgi:anti-sigma B factor antagonist
MKGGGDLECEREAAQQMATSTAQFWADVATVEGRTVISVSGEIDLSTVPGLRTEINALITGGARQLLLDLEAVTFMDSSGLNLLVGVVKLLGSGSVGVISAKPTIRRIFSISGLDQVIPIYASVAAALEATS